MIKDFLIRIAEPFYFEVFMPWFERMGFILYGGGGKGGRRNRAARGLLDEGVNLARQGTFKPFALTTSLGTATGGPSGEFGVTTQQPFTGIQQTALTGAQGLLGQAEGALARTPGQIDFTFDPLAAQQQMFSEQSALLDPVFAQQRSQLQNQLFGSGRMGLSLAGESVGAGGGMVQPDAFGLGRAQSQTLAELAAQTRQQAAQEQLQRFGVSAEQLQLNEALQQQRAQNLLSGGVGMFGVGAGVNELELANLQAALASEQARGASFLGASSGLTNAAQQRAGMNQSGGGKGLGGAILGGFGTALGGPIGGAIGERIGGMFERNPSTVTPAASLSGVNRPSLYSSF